MKKSDLLLALQLEIQRHDLSTFVDDPPSVAQGGRGVVVPGCPCCRARFGTIGQFIDHLTKDVLPAFLDRLSGKG
jgi:hypothetical protein